MGKKFDGVFISFENTKGGAGKSTLTAVMAGYLHSIAKEEGLSIGVVDIDDAQNSIGKLRLFEQAESENMSDEYQIMNISSADFVNQCNYLKKAFDIILVDFPGNLKQEGVVKSLMLIDIVIIPFEPSQIEVIPTIAFYEYYKSNILTKREANGFDTIVKGLPNRVMANLLEYKDIVTGRIELPFELLKNHVADSRVKYQRNLTTLIKYYDHSSDTIGNEIYQLIKDYVKGN